MRKLCIIYNSAPLYREGIFKLIDKEYECEWYFGETTSGIKEMNLAELANVSKYKTYGKPNVAYWQKGVLRLLFSRKYDTFLMLAETRCITTWLFLLLKTLFFRGKRVYAWSHGWYGKESKFESVLKILLFKMFTGTFLYGNFAKQIMRDKGFDPSKIFVIHNSLDYAKQLDLRKKSAITNIYKEHFGNNDPVLVMIGRLNKRKNLDLLIKAVAKLKKENLSYNIVLIGDGEDRQRLQDLVTAENLVENVWFYGACYDEEKNAELLYNADMCVVPGDIGLTAIHSLMFGVPAISHDKFMYQGPEFEAIIPGVTGDFFIHGSLDSLAEIIKAWFVKNYDNRDTVRKNCFKVIDEEWTPHFQIEILKKNIK